MNDMDEMGMSEQRRWNVPLCDRTVTCEVSGDYTLPDYQPEIRRLLTVRPTVLPPAKYVGGGQVELNGTVEYQVLYVGADGGLYTVPLSAEYSASVPTEQVGGLDLSAGVTAFASVVSEGVTSRVSAPRRMSIRSRLRCHVRAYGTMIEEMQVSGEAEPTTIRRLGTEARSMVAVSGLSDMIPVGEEIGGIGEDTRVISADGVVFLNEITPADGMAMGRGEVLLKLMLGRENGSIDVLSRRLPIEGTVELEGMTSDGTCTMRGIISDLGVTVEEGRILCEISVLLSAEGMRNRTVHDTADCYSTTVESECDYRTYRLPVALRCENGNLSQSERIPTEESNLPEGASIADAFGSVIFDGCEQAGESYLLTGQSRYWLLCQKDNEYSVTEVTLPLRYELDGGKEPPVSYDAVGEVLSCRARVDGDTLCLDAEISVTANFVGEEELTVVDTVRFGEPIREKGSRTVVYYPTPEDTSWTVAKRYHVSPEQLTEGSSYYLI